MALPAATPAPMPRAVARGHPASDPACAGCPLLGSFRALRRAGLDVQGRSGCEPGVDRPFAASQGAWAAVVGARRVLAGAQDVLAQAAAAGARVLVLADRDGPEARGAEALLAAAGAAVVALNGADLAGAEAAARAASVREGAALVALAPCRRGARVGAPLAVLPSRCNRCGACLGLGCPAIRDAGGEAMVVEPAVCSGCGTCAPLCRAGAIGPPAACVLRSR